MRMPPIFISPHPPSLPNAAHPLAPSRPDQAAKLKPTIYQYNFLKFNIGVIKIICEILILNQEYNINDLEL